jgi:hypothetical protein
VQARLVVASSAPVVARAYNPVVTSANLNNLETGYHWNFADYHWVYTGYHLAKRSVIKIAFHKFSQGCFQEYSSSTSGIPLVSPSVNNSASQRQSMEASETSGNQGCSSCNQLCYSGE